MTNRTARPRKTAYRITDNRLSSCIWEAWVDGKRETHCASPEDKAAAVELEKRGLVVVRRTEELCGGFHEWWVKYTPAAAAQVQAERDAHAALLAQAKQDWTTGRAYLRRGTYVVYPMAEICGVTVPNKRARVTKAPWSDLVKARFASCSDFHRAVAS
jgi:hypothetical protein